MGFAEKLMYAQYSGFRLKKEAPWVGSRVAFWGISSSSDFKG